MWPPLVMLLRRATCVPSRPESRFCANATCRPSGEIAGSRDALVPLTLCAPEPSGLTTQTSFSVWKAIGPLVPGNEALAGAAQDEQRDEDG